MCAKIATPKQTGGGGYNYEDKVGAYFLLCMLLRRYAFYKEIGFIVRVDFQAGADGWAFDDFLITLETDTDIQKVGISVKSNQQFSSGIISSALLKTLWEQQLGLNTKKFNRSSDYCCIAQPPLMGTLSSDLSTVINLARQQDASDLDLRLRTDGYISADRLRLYQSFHCPKEFQTEAKRQNLQNGDILSRFLFLEFDFEGLVSKSESEVLDMAASALLDDDMRAAVRLYEKLQQLCKNLKVQGGYLDLTKLIAVLKQDFDLKGNVSLMGDLRKVEETNRRNLSVIKTTIGTKFQIDRSAELKALETKLAQHNICNISAPSGHGKTVLAKLYAETHEDRFLLVWLNATYFDHPPELSLQLQHDFDEIAKLNVKEKVLFVIDGLERFYSDTQIRQLAAFLNKVISSGAEYEIVFTCITEDYDAMLLKLYQYNFIDPKLTSLAVDNQSLNFGELAMHFPNLLDLLRNSQFRTLLGNIKLLDALCFALNPISIKQISNNQFTESELIDFLWKNHIEAGKQGLLHANVLKTFAQVQANSLSMGVSSAVIDASQANALDGMIQQGLIYENEDRFYFQHDLYGDWARYKIIRSEVRNLKAYLIALDISSPLWAKAVRQYGISLLETKSQDNSWLKLYQQFDDESANEKVVKSLLLESVIFSTNTLKVLEEISKDLLDNEGELLTRLLEIFLLKATDVNPQVLEIAKDIKGFSIAEASAINRLPNLEYWVPIISFLSRHKELAIKVDYKHCARIARDWLFHLPKGFILRREMAELAYDLSAAVLNNRRYFYREETEDKKYAFEGLLIGYNEIPKTAGELLLKLAQRVPITIENIQDEDDRQERKSHRFRNAEKWPLGPFQRIDDKFKDVCLNRRSLESVFKENPEIANEILLAVLIKEPLDDYYENGLSDDLDLETPRNWYQPFYRRGPFLNLLNINPLPALDGIIKLVDFATTQWRSQFKDAKDSIYIELDIKGTKKKFYGNVSVYFWYRDIGVAPHSLVSALMAVERYLFEATEQKDVLETCIDYILDQSSSIAFIGLLTSIGKSYPALFRDRLRMIIERLDFYRWEKHNINSLHSNGFGINNLPKSQQEEAAAWNKEFHRSHPLDDIMINQLLNSPDFKVIYKSITSKWETELAPQRDDDDYDIYYDRLLSFFQPENYVLKPYKEGLEYYEYCEPNELKERMKPLRSDIDERQIRPSAFMIYQALDENHQFTLEEIVATWALVERLKDNKVADLFNPLETPLSSIFGSYVVFLKFREVWINEYPEYEGVMYAYTELIFNRIEREDIRVDNYSVHWDWCNFAPQLAAYFWAVEDSTTVRKWLTLICLNLHQESVMRLFAYLARLIKWNDPKFIELQNYVTQLAGVLNNVYQGEDLKQHTERITISRKFIDKEISDSPEPWANYRNYIPKGRKWSSFSYEEDEQELLNPGLDTNLLKAAYEKLPIRELPTDEEEKSHIIWLWKQAFDQVIYQLGDCKKLTKEIDEYPRDFDAWVITSVPALIAEDAEADFFTNFCQPLLEFGYFLPEYVEMYSTSILLNYLDQKEKYPKVIPVWAKIISFCLSHDNWKYRTNRRSKFLPLSLFLLVPDKIKVWDYDYIEFTKAASEHFLKFFFAKAINPMVIIALCSFAKTISGQQFLNHALLLVNNAVKIYVELSKQPVPEGAVRKPFFANEQLAKLLSYAWENKQQEITANEEIFIAYKELVVYLVSIHHPVGVELQTRLLV